MQYLMANCVIFVFITHLWTYKDLFSNFKITFLDNINFVSRFTFTEQIITQIYFLFDCRL